MKNNTLITNLASSVIIGMFAIPALAEDRGDRIDERLDNKGERIDERLDNRGTVLKIAWIIKEIESMIDLNEERNDTNILPIYLMRKNRHSGKRDRSIVTI